MYKCVIWSNSSYDREYTTASRSAVKNAMKYGRAESGEVVQIEAATGRIIARAIWDGEKYIRVNV